MKKVVLCIPTLDVGGAEKFVVDLATNIDKTEYDVTVAITRRNSKSSFKDLLVNAGVRIVDLSDDKYLKMLKKQMAFLRKERPDAVHTNIGSVLHMMFATWLIPVPVKLFTMHNQVAFITGQGKEKKLLHKLAFNLFGYTPVAICDQVADSLAEGFGLKREKIKKVNNGVNLERFHPIAEKTEGDTIKIISTGTMYPIKNHTAIIDAFSVLYQEDKRLRLQILGSGELYTQLRQKVEQLQLTEVIDMPGVQKNVENYLQKADIYVSASKTEGLPLSILEAMACGLPVVATAAGGTVDIVKTGVNGIIVPVNDTAALTDALRKLVTDDKMRNDCAAGSLRIVQDWSIEACVRGYEDLYQGK